MIPLIKPILGEAEISAVAATLRSGWVTQGPRVGEFECNFAGYVGSNYACAVSNCTAALQLALLAVGTKPGDVVLTVSHSFIATANSIRACAAEPIFVDIDRATLNLDPVELERILEQDCEERDGGFYYRGASKLAVGQSPLKDLIAAGADGTKFGRVAAILAVHQIGIPCEIEFILEIAKRFDLPVIEDAACAIGSEIQDPTGRWEKIGKPHADIACFSFHPRKLITTGDGGMLTTNNPDYDKQFRLLRHHGMGVADYARHNAEKIVLESYEVSGFNYRLTDIQAAVGIEQLRRLDEIIARRRETAKRYRAQLAKISWIECLAEPEGTRPNWQSFPIRLLDNAPCSSLELMQHLHDRGVSSRPGIMNAHQELPYQAQKWLLPNSEAAREQIVLIPLFHDMGRDILTTVVTAISDAPIGKANK